MFVAWTTAASAHAHLTSADPADGATVGTAPRELRLTFSEGLEEKLSGVTLSGPAQTNVATGSPSLANGDDRQLIVPLPEPLQAGTYTVNWHALSKDGHTTHSSYQFTVGP